MTLPARHNQRFSPLLLTALVLIITHPSAHQFNGCHAWSLPKHRPRQALSRIVLGVQARVSPKRIRSMIPDGSAGSDASAKGEGGENEENDDEETSKPTNSSSQIRPPPDPSSFDAPHKKREPWHRRQDQSRAVNRGGKAKLRWQNDEEVQKRAAARATSSSSSSRSASPQNKPERFRHGVNLYGRTADGYGQPKKPLGPKTPKSQTKIQDINDTRRPPPPESISHPPKVPSASTIRAVPLPKETPPVVKQEKKKDDPPRGPTTTDSTAPPPQQPTQQQRAQQAREEQEPDRLQRDHEQRQARQTSQSSREYRNDPYDPSHQHSNGLEPPTPTVDPVHYDTRRSRPAEDEFLQQQQQQQRELLRQEKIRDHQLYTMQLLDHGHDLDQKWNELAQKTMNEMLPELKGPVDLTSNTSLPEPSTSQPEPYFVSDAQKVSTAMAPTNAATSLQGPQASPPNAKTVEKLRAKLQQKRDLLRKTKPVGFTVNPKNYTDPAPVKAQDIMKHLRAQNKTSRDDDDTFSFGGKVEGVQDVAQAAAQRVVSSVGTPSDDSIAQLQKKIDDASAQAALLKEQIAQQAAAAAVVHLTEESTSSPKVTDPGLINAETTAPNDPKAAAIAAAAAVAVTTKTRDGSNQDSVTPPGTSSSSSHKKSFLPHFATAKAATAASSTPTAGSSDTVTESKPISTQFQGTSTQNLPLSAATTPPPKTKKPWSKNDPPPPRGVPLSILPESFLSPAKPVTPQAKKPWSKDAPPPPVGVPLSSTTIPPSVSDESLAVSAAVAYTAAEFSKQAPVFEMKGPKALPPVAPQTMLPLEAAEGDSVPSKKAAHVIPPPISAQSPPSTARNVEEPVLSKPKNIPEPPPSTPQTEGSASPSRNENAKSTPSIDSKATANALSSGEEPLEIDPVPPPPPPPLNTQAHADAWNKVDTNMVTNDSTMLDTLREISDSFKSLAATATQKHEAKIAAEELARVQEEAEKQAQAEKARIQAAQEIENRKIAAEELARAQAEAAKQAEEERARAKAARELEARRVEEARLRAIEEQVAKEAAEARKEAEKARMKAVEEQKAREADTRAKLAAEKQAADEEARLKAVAEKRAAEEMARIKAEEEVARIEAAKEKEAAEDRRRAREAERRAAEEQARMKAAAERQARIRADEVLQESNAWNKMDHDWEKLDRDMIRLLEDMSGSWRLLAEKPDGLSFSGKATQSPPTSDKPGGKSVRPNVPSAKSKSEMATDQAPIAQANKEDQESLDIEIINSTIPLTLAEDGAVPPEISLTEAVNENAAAPENELVIEDQLRKEEEKVARLEEMRRAEVQHAAEKALAEAASLEAIEDSEQETGHILKNVAIKSDEQVIAVLDALRDTWEGLVDLEKSWAEETEQLNQPSTKLVTDEILRQHEEDDQRIVDAWVSIDHLLSENNPNLLDQLQVLNYSWLRMASLAESVVFGAPPSAQSAQSLAQQSLVVDKEISFAMKVEQTLDILYEMRNSWQRIVAAAHATDTSDIVSESQVSVSWEQDEFDELSTNDTASATKSSFVTEASVAPLEDSLDFDKEIDMKSETSKQQDDDSWISEGVDAFLTEELPSKGFLDVSDDELERREIFEPVAMESDNSAKLAEANTATISESASSESSGLNISPGTSAFGSKPSFVASPVTSTNSVGAKSDARDSSDREVISALNTVKENRIESDARILNILSEIRDNWFTFANHELQAIQKKNEDYKRAREEAAFAKTRDLIYDPKKFLQDKERRPFMNSDLEFVDKPSPSPKSNNFGAAALTALVLSTAIGLVLPLNFGLSEPSIPYTSTGLSDSDTPSSVLVPPVDSPESPEEELVESMSLKATEASNFWDSLSEEAKDDPDAQRLWGSLRLGYINTVKEVLGEDVSLDAATDTQDRFESLSKSLTIAELKSTEALADTSSTDRSEKAPTNPSVEMTTPVVATQTVPSSRSSPLVDDILTAEAANDAALSKVSQKADLLTKAQEYSALKQSDRLLPGGARAFSDRDAPSLF